MFFKICLVLCVAQTWGIKGDVREKAIVATFEPRAHAVTPPIDSFLNSMDPEDDDKVLRSGRGHTTPRGSWLFMTIDTSDLAKLLIEKASRSKQEDSQRRLDVPQIVELVRNLTNDYDNENLVGKFNKTLRQMDLPTCHFRAAASACALYTFLVPFLCVSVMFL